MSIRLPQFRNIATKSAFWMCMLIGLIFVGRALRMALPSILLEIVGTKTQGKVIENDRGIFPMVEFYTPDGRQVMFTSAHGTEPPEFAVGTTVTVLYDRTAPDDFALIDSFEDLWFWPMVCFVAGAVILTITLLFAYGGLVGPPFRFVIGGRDKGGTVSEEEQSSSSGGSIPQIVLVGMMMAGIALLVFGTVRLISALHLEFSATRTEGRVVRNIDTDEGFFPLIAFNTADGKTVQFKGGTASSPADYAEGDKVTVLYWYGHPESATILSFSEMWWAPAMLIPVGLLLMFICIREW